jgi:sigma-B regulation protein RsbU (phosphoserine phosphatase)
MLLRSAPLQYVLLALVAALAFTHVYLGGSNNYQSLAYGHLRSRLPFSDSYYGPFAAQVTPEGKAAGLADGDAVLSVNQRPYTGNVVLLEEVRKSRPGQVLTVTRRHGESSPTGALITLRPERKARARAVGWVLRFSFLLIALLCLLLGIYVVFARPHSLNAWLILGILAYFDPLFVDAALLKSQLRLVAQIWSDLAQTAMPLCLMIFGVYFPDRSVIDIRYPWIKWVIAIPALAFLPADFL